MKRSGTLLLALVVILTGMAVGQSYTAASGTITDGNAIPYANCTVNIALVNTSGFQPLFGGNPLTTTTYSTRCDPTGAFAVTLPSNAVITVGGATTTQWGFNVCAQDKVTCFNSSNTVSGSTTDLTTALSTASINQPCAIYTSSGTPTGLALNGNCGSGSSGGGSPGSPLGSLQWNNGGAFGGITGWITNGLTTITGGATSILDLHAMPVLTGFLPPRAAGAAPTGFACAINSTTGRLVCGDGTTAQPYLSSNDVGLQCSATGIQTSTNGTPNTYTCGQLGGDALTTGASLSASIKAVHWFVTTTKTTTYTVGATDYQIPLDATGGAFAVNLPAATGSGRELNFKKLDSSANAVTLTPSGADTIDGAATQPMATLNANQVIVDSASGKWYKKQIVATGGDLTGAANNATVAKVDGVSYPASPSNHQTPVITASNTATYKTIPDCTDTGGNHLNFTQSTDIFSCGTSGGGGGGGGGTITYSSPSVTLTGTSYFSPGGGNVPSATESNVQVAASAAATISGLTVQLGATPTSGNVAFTVRKCTPSSGACTGSDQTLTCTITNPAVSCTDATHSFSVAVGDLISVKAVVSSVAAASTLMAQMAWGTSNVGVTSVTSANTDLTIATTTTTPVITNTPGNNVVVAASYIADGGSANAITGTTTNTFPGAYAVGQTVRVKMNASNTGATTININSLGNKNVTKGGATALILGDLLSGHVYTMTYDGTEFVAQLPTSQMFGSQPNQGAAAGTPRYISLTSTSNTTENVMQVPMSKSGTFRNLSAVTITTQPANSATLTLQTCTPSGGACTGAGCTITVTITGGATANVWTDTTHSCTVSVGDYIDYKLVQNTTGTSATISTVSIDFIEQK